MKMAIAQARTWPVMHRKIKAWSAQTPAKTQDCDKAGLVAVKTRPAIAWASARYMHVARKNQAAETDAKQRTKGYAAVIITKCFPRLLS